MRCLEMRSYQLLKRKKSERLLKMGEEKWPSQVREQRGLCLQCLAKSPIYWSKRVVGGVDKKEELESAEGIEPWSTMKRAIPA